MKDTEMTNKVFVAIPCWRDPFVYETIKSAYEHAFDKDSLAFGVFFQGYPEDDWMISDIHEKLPGVDIRIKTVHGDDAPDFLCQIKRTITDELMADEEYYMQVDSHTKFRRNWDIMLKAELLIANRIFGKSVINSQTVYFDHWSDKFLNDPLTSYADPAEWRSIADTLNFPYPISLNGRVSQKPLNTMIREKFYNGNMVFAHRDYLKDAPFPWEMAQCFEQQMSMLRAWTAGYEVVSPIHAYTNNFNYWKPEGVQGDPYVRHIRWDRPEQEVRILQANLDSYEKYNSIFTDPEVTYNEEFGAMKERTIEEYIDFIKYNPVTLEIREAIPVDLSNSVTISDELFNNTVLEIAKNNGYVINNINDVVIDPYSRKMHE